MKNKKAMSEIVATALIIVLTLAAVAVIWAWVLPLLTKGESASSCFDAVSQFSITDACVTPATGGVVKIWIKQDSGTITLDSIKFIVIGSDGTKAPLTTAPPTYVTLGLGPNKVVTYTTTVAYTPTTAAKVSMAPIIKTTGTEVCSETAPVTVRFAATC